MSTKITVMYELPQHPDAFEAGYNDQLVLAASIPGLQRVETHRSWPTGLERPRLAYRLVELFFEGPDALRDAMVTPEAGRFFPIALELGAGGAHIVVHEEAS